MKAFRKLIMSIAFALAGLQSLAGSGAPSTLPPSEPALTPISEYALLKSLPPGRLAALTKVRAQWIQDWRGAVRQRSVLWYVINAVVEGDLATADAAWTTVDATFALQLDDGGFPGQPSPEHPQDYDTPTFRVQGTFFYIQEVAHAIMVIQQSPYEEHFRTRIEVLKPQMRRACEFICRGYDTIIANSSRGPNRMFIAAKALGLCGLILHDEQFKTVSRRLVRAALSHRYADGAFIEYNDRDSSYNMVSVLQGEVLALHLPFPELQTAFDGAIKWELTRIRPSGEIEVVGNSRTGVGKETFMGHPKGVNYNTVLLALTYYGLIHRDSAALAAAERIFAWTQNNRQS